MLLNSSHAKRFTLKQKAVAVSHGRQIDSMRISMT